MTEINNDNDWQFAGIADGYEKYLAPVLSKWTDAMFEKTELSEGEDVLDFACGTGIVTRRLADSVDTPGTVVGLDVEPAMLEVARTTASSLPINVQWYEANAEQMPFSDESFDVAYCQQGLQFMDNPTDALTEAHRVLRPGGRLAVGVWSKLDDSPHYAALTAALEKFAPQQAAAAMRAPFDALSSPDKLRRCIESAGFEEVQTEAITHQVSYPSAEEFFRREVVSWLADPVGDLSESSRHAIVTMLERSLERHINDGTLQAPMKALIAWGMKS